jgi:hypothetical protein
MRKLGFATRRAWQRCKHEGPLRSRAPARVIGTPSLPQGTHAAYVEGMIDELPYPLEEPQGVR